MKTTFDLKSLLAGVAVAVIAFLALGASRSDSPAVDHFRITTTTNHVFVIDTTTGQVWAEYIVPRQDTRNEQFMPPRLSLGKN